MVFGKKKREKSYYKIRKRRIFIAICNSIDHISLNSHSTLLKEMNIIFQEFSKFAESLDIQNEWVEEIQAIDDNNDFSKAVRKAMKKDKRKEARRVAQEVQGILETIDSLLEESQEADGFNLSKRNKKRIIRLMGFIALFVTSYFEVLGFKLEWVSLTQNEARRAA